MINIFVVDDDQDNIFLIRHALKKIQTPNTAEFFTSATACIQRMENTPPHLIIMDLYMPAMNGHEATKLIKANPLHRDIPVYIFSTSDLPGDMKASLEAGAAGHLVKALDYNDVVKQLTAILNRISPASH